MTTDEKKNKRLIVSVPLLLCYSMFTVWQMGVVFYTGDALSLDGKTPLPISVNNMTAVIVAAYILSILYLIFFQKYSVITARAGILLSLATALGVFLPLPAGILAALITAQVFCCVFLIGVSISVVVSLFDEHSEILDVLITSVIALILIAALQNDTVRVPFTVFRAVTVIALAALVYFYFRMPAKADVRYIKKSDGIKCPVRFAVGIFFLIGLSCILMLFGNTVGESIRNGVSVLYFSAALCGAVIFVLWRVFHISPLRCATALTGIAAAGFVLALAGGESEVFTYISCAMLGCGYVSCMLTSFYGIVLFRRYPSRFIVPAIVTLAVLTVILHSVLLDALRENIHILYVIYAVAAVITTVLYLIVEPSLIWSMRKSVDNTGKPSETTEPPKPDVTETVEPPKLSVTETAAPPQKLRETIQSISTSELDKLLAPFTVEPLSGHELRIAELILNGYTSAEMVDILGITLNTVKSYRKNLHAKLQIHSRRELFSLVNYGKRIQ